MKKSPTPYGIGLFKFGSPARIRLGALEQLLFKTLIFLLSFKTQIPRSRQGLRPFYFNVIARIGNFCWFRPSKERHYRLNVHLDDPIFVVA